MTLLARIFVNSWWRTMGLESAEAALNPYRDRIHELEAEVAALRKRFVMDDAAAERALKAWFPDWDELIEQDKRAAAGATVGGELYTAQCRREMRAAITAALKETQMSDDIVDIIATYEQATMPSGSIQFANVLAYPLIIMDLARKEIEKLRAERDAARDKALEEAATLCKNEGFHGFSRNIRALKRIP